ncbi:Outer membrane protein assembly factor BamB [Stieleria neptunia]|uniref:Outer membrane protein assembly factor BamB n=1 Tax=Stieleria neptunia TaxID=2527979 RepID=A0A518HLQ8_9BACT|nr:PQQ-binding-like beta-propeller repeat protein [Stieleria neptunia]QDV41792.1 Outer membrane protein assembly factor BamB [Stieleria neptunia]
MTKLRGGLTVGLAVIVAAVVWPAAIFAAPGANAGDWPQFRGPDGKGTAVGEDYPLTWGPEKNIKWKIDLADPGAGSPIVSGGRVFLASATEDGRQRSLLCIDRNDGMLLWTRTVEFGEDITHSKNPFGSTTPATDGEHVVVWHGSAGLHCYDFAGKPLWSRDLGEFKHIWGYGSSPILYKDKVLLQTGPGERVFVTAIDLASGKTLWETDEPYSGDKSPDDVGSWSTPVVAHVDGQPQVICAMSTRVNAYDLDSGDLLWWCDGLNGSNYDVVSSSPLIGDGIGFAMADLRGPAMGFKLGGSGDVTASNRLWHVEKRNPSSVGTGVMVGRHIYRPNSGPGTLECLDAETGESLWKSRARDHWASMVLAGGHLYALSQRGTTVVLKPNPQAYEQVASNELDGVTNATPAFSEGEIFLRTEEHLYCIGK